MLLSRKDTWKPLGIILGEPMSEPMPMFLLPHDSGEGVLL